MLVNAARIMTIHLFFRGGRYGDFCLLPAAFTPGHAPLEFEQGIQFLLQLVPANPFKAAADGNLLPVIVFVTIFAIAAASLPLEKRAPLVNLADVVTEALIRVIHWVLLVARGLRRCPALP